MTAILIAGAPAASAATEVGSNCAGDALVGSYTLLQLAKSASNPLPIAAPAAGVVTKWKVNSAHSDSFNEQLRVFRPTGNPNEFQSIAESVVETISPGQNAFDARISIHPGDRFGAKGVSPSGTLFCTGDPDPANVLGAYAGDFPVGSTGSFFELEELQAAVSAIVEPDVDFDGYGDETQDQCPESAGLQVACPLPIVSASPIVKRRAVFLMVNVSSTAMVTVYGQAKWRFTSKPTRRTHRSKKRTMTARLHRSSRTVGSGQDVLFKLPLPKRVTRQLSQVTRKKSIRLRLTARVIDPLQRFSRDIVELRLRGWRQ